jgi:class 3 adenylate cyclase
MRLRHKIALLVVALQTVLVVSFTFQGYLQESRRAKESMSQYARMVAKLTAGRWITDLMAAKRGNAAEFDRFVNVVLSMDSRIAAIVVADGNQRILAGEINPAWVDYKTSESMALTALLGEAGKRKGFKSVSVALDSGGQEVGSVRVIFSLAAQGRELFRSAVIASLAAFGFTILGIAGAFFIAKKVTGPVQKVVDAMSLVEEGDLNQRVDLATRDEIGQMARAFNKMVDGLRENVFVKDAFSRYVSRQVAHKIIRDRVLNLNGEKRIVTVLFGDMRGFTTLSSQLPPEEIFAMLNDYFAIMVDVVFKYGGMFDKFIGDAIMAVFNAPLDLKDHELRAILTGLEIQEKVAVLNVKRSASGSPLINIGIGINTGDAVAGNIGAGGRIDYTVIGAGVNLAQRIESRTEKGKLFISESTYEAVKQWVDVIRLEPMTLKGLDTPVQLFWVTGARPPEGFYEDLQSV